jgi:hypothetical protein
MTPQPWEADDIVQRLHDVALNHGPMTPSLAADAANEIQYLRSMVDALR